MWGKGRNALFAGLIGCVNLSLFASFAFAQSYPVKPVHVLVGFTPGGLADVTVRILAPQLSETLGQSIIIENRAGASGAIATARVATSPADGYTLLLTTSIDVTLPALRKLPYDLERDLASVSLLGIMPYVLVVPASSPAHNVKELIELARPGKLSFGSVGIGSQAHLSSELFSLMTKVNMTHVPYKGGGELAVATATGQIDMSFGTIPTVLPLLSAGRLKPIAVSVAQRTSLLPSIPTLDESGLPGFDGSAWVGVLAPAGVPKEIIAQLNAAIGKVVNTPKMKESLGKQGLEPRTDTPEEFAAFIHSELDKYARLCKSIGLKVE